jgi:hypothetical protein
MARALLELSRWSEEVFQVGIRYLQLEPVLARRRTIEEKLAAMDAAHPRTNSPPPQPGRRG